MVAQELQNGQFPVRMMTGMLNGYGYPNSIFYCDLFLYLPAVLYNCMLPLRTCYQFYVTAVTAATCAIAYYAARRMAVLREHRPRLYRGAAAVLTASCLLYAGAFLALHVSSVSTGGYLTTTASDTMNVGAGEYRLSGSEEVDLTRARPAAQSEALLVKWYDKTNGEAHITLENTGGEETAVLLPIFDYGHYKAADAATGEEMTLTTGEGMLLQLAVPAGYTGSVTVRYAAPWYWHAAEAVSLLTAAVLAAWAVRKKAAGKRGKNGPAAPA